MLSKEFRLAKKKEVEAVFRRGKFARKDFLGLKCLKKNSEEKPKIAVVVSLKVEKRATLRNKLKRQIREIIRKNLPQIEKGYHIVIFAYNGASEQSFGQIKKNLEELLKKSSLLK